MVNKSSKNGWIQVLRLCLSICVFLFHFTYFGQHNPEFSNAFLLFFILSGFLICKSCENEENLDGFLKRKIIRLLPLYYLLTVFTFVAGQFVPFLGYKPTVVQLIKSLLFIPFSRNAIKTATSIKPIVGLGWTLQIDILFYLIYFIVFRFISKKYRNEITLLVLFIMYLLPSFITSDSIYFTYYFSDSKSLILSLIYGILTYLVYKLIGKYTKYISAIVIVFFIICSMLKIDNAYITLLFGSGLIYLCLFLEEKIKAPKILISGGNLNYSFYLIHYYVVAMAEKIYVVDSLSLTNIGYVMLVYGVCIGASYISNILIEKKFGNYLSKKLDWLTI